MNTGASYQITPVQGNGYWNCGRCGALVPNGCVHACPTSYVTPKPFTAPIPRDRVADALERIAAALERLASKEG